MKAAGIIEKEAATKRILNAGFRAVAEYDQFGQLVGARGNLSSNYAWTRVTQIAQSRAGIETEEKATAILLGDMFVAALDLEGGGTLLTISEQLVTDVAAEELTRGPRHCGRGLHRSSSRTAGRPRWCFDPGPDLLRHRGPGVT
jgi:hypothetical protein